MKTYIKRRMYPLVNGSHQYRFLAIILIYIAIVVAFLMVAVFLPDILQLRDENLSFDVRAHAAENILALHSRVWPGLITLICLIGLHSVRVFLRFVGPLYRMTQAFREVRGCLRPRKYIFFCAEMMNEFMAGPQVFTDTGISTCVVYRHFQSIL